MKSFIKNGHLPLLIRQPYLSKVVSKKFVPQQN